MKLECNITIEEVRIRFGDGNPFVEAKFQIHPLDHVKPNPLIMAINFPSFHIPVEVLSLIEEEIEESLKRTSDKRTKIKERIKAE